MKQSWRKCFGTTFNQGDIKHNNNRNKLKTAILERNMKISNSHVSTSVKKAKRFRIAFTTAQVTYLEKEFWKYPYIGNSRRKDVASVLDIPERAVKIWFQNRRMKEKKDSMTKELDGDSKATSEVEQKLYFFYPKRDQALSLPQLSSPQSSNTGSFLNSVNQSKVNVSPQYLVQENKVDSGTLYRSKSLTPSAPASDVVSPDNLSKNTVQNFKTENKARTQTSEMLGHIQGGIVKGHRSAQRKVSDRKNTVPPQSPILLPQDLSSCKKAASRDQKMYKEPKAKQEHSALNLTSGTSAAATGTPVFVGGLYPQPYIPPGNMIWKPVNVAPMMSTRLPAEGVPSIPFGQQFPANGNCKCDCHLKYNSVLFQQNSHNHLQYFITAVPISGQPPV